MFIRRLVLSICLIVAALGVAHADPHPARYTKRVALLGVTFEVNGRTCRLVRVPFKAFDGAKYVVIYPVLDGSDGSFRTVHSDKPFTSNTTISGFPAYMSIQDGREYQVAGAIGKSASFDVQGFANGTATVQVGTTLVSVSLFQYHDVGDIDGLHRFHETFVRLGDAVDVTPYADWATWRDLKPEASAIDTLFDYIQIIPL